MASRQSPPVPEIKYSFVTQVVTGTQGFLQGGVTNVPSKATCPSGWALVGGGYRWNEDYICPFAHRFVVDNRPEDSPTSSPDTWLVTLECSRFQAYAVCAQLQPIGGGQAVTPEVEVVEGTPQADSTNGWSSEATCPAGFSLSGGGHRHIRGDVSNYSDSRMIWTSQPKPDSSNTWKTLSIDFVQSAIALCVKLPPEVKAQNLTGTVVVGNLASNQQRSIAYCKTGYSLTGAGHDTAANDGCAANLIFSKLTYPRTDNHSVEVVKDCAKFNAKAICLAVVDK